MKIDFISDLNEQIAEINTQNIKDHIEKGNLDMWLNEWRAKTAGIGFNLFVLIKNLSKSDTISELEKIKAEIDGLHSDCLYGEQLVSKPETMQIIDNYIKELKGENK